MRLMLEHRGWGFWTGEVLKSGLRAHAGGRAYLGGGKRWAGLQSFYLLA